MCCTLLKTVVTIRTVSFNIQQFFLLVFLVCPQPAAPDLQCAVKTETAAAASVRTAANVK